jgi:ligand-binding sensor domain-containing protein
LGKDEKMKLKGILESGTIAFVIATLISSCAGQSKAEVKNTEIVQNSLGEIVVDLAPNTHLIYQDRNHNYWFGNDTGTYKYDGKTLLRFTQKDGLISNRILGMQEDKLGNIYFDTPEGVSKFDGQQFETLNVIADHPEKNKWKSEPDDLWFRMGWDRKGPYRFDGENLYYVEFPKSKIEDDFYAKYPNVSYNPYSMYSMFKDSKGNSWFGTADLGIYQFDGDQIRWMHEEHLGTSPEGGAFGIRSIIEDKDGYFWICNTNYKFKMLPESKDDDEQLKSLNYEREKGVVDEHDETLYFMSMVLDDNGILWMVNGDGMWKNNGQELVQFFINDGKSDISPTSVCKDDKGDLWFGTESDGIYKLDGGVFEKAVFNENDSQH